MFLEKATPEDNACFKKAIFEITENGGMLINSTIIASLITGLFILVAFGVWLYTF